MSERTLKEYARLLESAADRIEADQIVLLRQTLERLRDYASIIAHRNSGEMAESMYVLGPFPIGAGTLEGTVQSGAFYAAFEVGLGGSHDWASRTIQEQEIFLQQLADAIGAKVIARVELR